MYGFDPIPRVCSSFYRISFCPKFNLIMFKIEPVNLHEQFASDYLIRLVKIYLKKKKFILLTLIPEPLFVFVRH